MNHSVLRRLLSVFFVEAMVVVGLLPSQAWALVSPQQPPSNFSAAYLNPDSGRFWTMDSFEGSREDSLSLHKYLYAHANPVIGVDPSGNYTSLAEAGVDTQSRAQVGSMNAATLNTGRANLIGKLITLAQAAVVAIPFVLEQIAEQSISASTVAEVRPAVDEMINRDRGRYVYFFHATPDGDWLENGVPIDPKAGGGDFGTGFYTYRLDAGSALEFGFDWIRRKIERGDTRVSTKIIGIFRMPATTYGGLGKEYVWGNPLAVYSDTVRQCWRGRKKLFNTDVVIGPTAEKNYMGSPIPNPNLPNQYKFESPQAIGKLELVLPITVP